MKNNDFKLIGVSIIVSSCMYFAFYHATKSLPQTHKFAFQNGISLISSLQKEQQSLHHFMKSSNFSTLPSSNQKKLSDREKKLNTFIPQLELATQHEEQLRAQGKIKQADKIMMAIDEYYQAYLVKDMDKVSLRLPIDRSNIQKNISQLELKENIISQNILRLNQQYRFLNNTNNITKKKI